MEFRECTGKCPSDCTNTEELKYHSIKGAHELMIDKNITLKCKTGKAGKIYWYHQSY